MSKHLSCCSCYWFQAGACQLLGMCTRTAAAITKVKMVPSPSWILGSAAGWEDGEKEMHPFSARLGGYPAPLRAPGQTQRQCTMPGSPFSYITSGIGCCSLPSPHSPKLALPLALSCGGHVLCPYLLLLQASLFLL